MVKHIRFDQDTIAYIYHDIIVAWNSNRFVQTFYPNLKSIEFPPNWLYYFHISQSSEDNSDPFELFDSDHENPPSAFVSAIDFFPWSKNLLTYPLLIKKMFIKIESMNAFLIPDHLSDFSNLECLNIGIDFCESSVWFADTLIHLLTLPFPSSIK